MTAKRKLTIIVPGKVTRTKSGKLRYYSRFKIEAKPTLKTSKQT